jgi:hypothetical protein
VQLENVRPGIVADYIEIILSADDLLDVNFRRKKASPSVLGPARKFPKGSTMQLPPRQMTVSGSLPNAA